MRQELNEDVKNILVLGKTGQGKSHFLNLLLQEEKPKYGTFRTFASPNSGTHECQIAENKTVSYGMGNNQPNCMITMNLIDTPGLFDTQDNQSVQDDNLPNSIKHLMEIEKVVKKGVFQQQVSRVFLVISAESKFDDHQKAMIDICKILIGQELKVSIIVTKCQRLYDIEDEEEQLILGNLHKFKKEWMAHFATYKIEDVFFFSNQSINNNKEKYQSINEFYNKQWFNLYFIMQKSIKSKMNCWGDLSLMEKLIVGKYFGYTANSGGGCVSLNVLLNGINNNNIEIKKNINALLSNKLAIKDCAETNYCIGMIHYSPVEQCMFIKLSFSHSHGKSYVELTSDHLIYCWNRKQFITANLITLKDTLQYINNDYKEEVKITEISVVSKTGYYSPLTTKGQFFGNGILLSCYVSPQNFPVSQLVAHLVMKPLIFYRQFSMKSIANMEQGIDRNQEYQEYQAPYSKLLEKIFCHK